MIRYRDKLSVITAKHCINPANGDDIRIVLDRASTVLLPLKYLHRAISDPINQAFADIAVMEAAPESLDTEELSLLKPLELDGLENGLLGVQEKAKLFVPGFPKWLNGVDFDRSIIRTQAYLTGGIYKAPDGRPGIHAMTFDELEWISWPDGMSGSPVFLIEELPEAHYYGFAGMLIEATRVGEEAAFIGADVIYRFLDGVVSSADARIVGQ